MTQPDTHETTSKPVMPETPVSIITTKFFSDIKRNWGWILLEGVVLVILGLIAIFYATPLFTMSSILLFGILLLLAAIPQFVICIRSSDWKVIAFHLLIGALYLYGGLLAIIRPAAASVIITFMLACFLLAVGVVRLIQAYQHRTMRGWGWVLFSAILAIIMGLIIIADWPFSGLWVIGLFVGIELLFSGLAAINIAIAAKDLPEPQEE